jgi:RNA exonuclease 4
VQKEVSDLLQNRILVGHALKHDMKVLFLDHPRKLIRDTSVYKYFRNSFGGKTPSLKRLSERMLGVKVQVRFIKNFKLHLFLSK